MKELLIIGARGFGRVVYDLALECIKSGLNFKIKGFLDDDANALNGYEGYPSIISSVENYNISENDVFICALGTPVYKKKYVDIIASKGGHFISLVHPTAALGRNAVLGEGCIICLNTNIGQDVKLGNFVTLDGYSSVGHDASVGDYSHIGAYSFAAGYVHIESGVVVHPGAKIVPHKRIGRDSIIGVGSVVISNVREGSTVFGNPAKKMEL